jgi:hypothetical protein
VMVFGAIHPWVFQPTKVFFDVGCCIVFHFELPS